jgi:hypothetical protein
MDPADGIDPVTKGLDIFVRQVGVSIDLKFWVKQVSFLFLGVLVGMAVRGLLIQFTKVIYLHIILIF